MISVHLDEVSDNYTTAINMLAYYGIDNVIINDIYTDTQLHAIRSICKNNNITVNAFVSDEFSDSTINKASFIGAKYACFNNYECDHQILAEMKNKIVGLNMRPMIKFKQSNEFVSFIQLLYKVRYHVLYDPADVLKVSKHDHITKYWILLNRWTRIIYAHDYKTGFGAKPVGFGDCNFERVFQNMNESCIVALKHGLGSKYPNCTTKEQVFALALDALRAKYDT
jgi:hypothetical protein